ncbi:MAG: hypothetical protein JXA73_03340 [Acidobacteria bacterium]|nr:hypothetical protein [Acidobacteriota bacterium]
MPGFVEIANIRYCLIPEKCTMNGDYWHDTTGPRLESPLNRIGEVVDASGMIVERARPILEKKLWTPGDLLITINRWPVYPLSRAFLDTESPAVIDEIIKRTAIVFDSTGGEATFEINWEGLKISRKYRMLKLGIGFAAWPRKALQKWQRFYFLFAGGSQTLVQNATPIFAGCTPIVFGYSDRDGGVNIIASETKITRNNFAAYSRLGVAPRGVSFKDNKTSEFCGVLPLRIDEDGNLVSPEPGMRGRNRRSSFATALPKWISPADDATQPDVKLAVDFGTSNTAVAFSPDGLIEPSCLPFDNGLRAVNLTASAGLDPTLREEEAYRFFPLAKHYSNPLPTILFEWHDIEEFDDKSQLLPVRAIPEISEIDNEVIQHFAIDGLIKQDFKWKYGNEAEIHRQSYLEHIGLLTGWALRTNPSTMRSTTCTVTFTCPLAFSRDQTRQFRTGVNAFINALSSCGIQAKPKGMILSESQANFFYGKSQQQKGSGGKRERVVIVDIGGGTTDISIFDGAGSPLLMDSLYIGGKDLSSTLLMHRMKQKQDQWPSIVRVLGLQSDNSRRPSIDLAWAEMAQCVLINRMKLSIEALAQDVEEAAMSDFLGEVIAILVFATLYAVRMASLPLGTSEKAERISVWFSGFGSRLFNLAPTMKRLINRRLGALAILKKAISRYQELGGIPITFSWEFEKESVCKGALMVPNDDRDAGRHRFEEDDLEIQTLWWGDIPISPPVAWHSLYNRKTLRRQKSVGFSILRHISLS